MQRPESFRINHSHSLARGLVFAGLGRIKGTTHYHDSSLHRNYGTLTNMVPADDWTWVDELGRWGLDFDGSDDYAIQSRAFGGGSVDDFAISFWMSTTISSGPVFPFGVFEDGTAGGIDIGLNTTDGTNNSTGYVRYYVRDSSGNADSFHYGAAGTIWRSGEWTHHALLRKGGVTTLYGNGDLSICSSLSDSLGTGVITFARPMAIGARNVRGTVGGFARVNMADFCVHSRALSLAEIAVLANPADPMLGGLLLPPKRKYYAVRSTALSRRFKLGKLLVRG